MLNDHSFDFLLSLCSYKQLNGIESMKMQFKDQYLIRTLFHNDCTTRRLFPRIYSYIFDNSLPPFVLLSFNFEFCTIYFRTFTMLEFVDDYFFLTKLLPLFSPSELTYGIHHENSFNWFRRPSSTTVLFNLRISYQTIYLRTNTFRISHISLLIILLLRQ